MKGGKTPRGYTILEVLIVLAVSGLVFLMAMNFVNGKQGKTSFQTGANEMASRVQDLINSVVDGQYSDYPITCQATGSGITATAAAGATPTASKQGQNDDCVFLGKALKASPGDTKYQILSIAGLRAKSNGDPIKLWSEASPTTIDGLTTDSPTPQVLTIVNMKTNAGTVVDGFGLLQNLANDDGRGSRQLPGLYTAPGGNVASGTQISSLDMCVTDGERNAKITIGMSGSQQNVKVTMLGSNPC